MLSFSLPDVRGGANPVPVKSGAAAGSAGVAVPLSLSALLLGLPLLADPGIPGASQIGAFFQMLTWITGFIASVIACGVGIKSLRRRHVAMSQPFMIKQADEYARLQDLKALEEYVEARFKEQTTYLHDEVHAMREELQAVRVSGEDGRESLHNRLNPLVEITAYMRGKLDFIANSVVGTNPGVNHDV